VSDAGTPLTVIQGGINRLRTKGGASKQSLYDLLNGYVTSAKTVKVRPGTIRTQSLSSDTKGLVAFKGGFHTFSHKTVSVPAGYTLHILTHPLSGGDTLTPIAKIHFAAPFMGFLYVVAEFEATDTSVIDAGLIWHYWMQEGDTWAADTVYKIGDIVTPATKNGLAYKAFRVTNPNPAWVPHTLEALNTLVEPNIPNGFYYKATSADGDNPVTGATEPTWPIVEGQTVEESSQMNPAESSGGPTTANPATQPSTDQPSSGTAAQYTNPATGSTNPPGSPPGTPSGWVQQYNSFGVLIPGKWGPP
jgi:hypothetical protein